jgi:IS5 family transposase
LVVSELTESGVIEKAFNQFETYLCKRGFSARKGQIVDAGLVPVPKQRNSREENNRIKQGEVPEDWSEQKKRQKDADARWTKKNGQNYHGYKNHVDVDVKHKLIRSYEVSSAWVHESQVFEDLPDVDYNVILTEL